MPNTSSNRDDRILRFGVFEVDLGAGVLRKNGTRIRLQVQPFQVLVALLQNAGQVVTRDDLRATIWPADSFVDFDHSLNTAVNKIRDSLDDSASNPRPPPMSRCTPTCMFLYRIGVWYVPFSR
jgi:DNA-binding response OmpR family regulator